MGRRKKTGRGQGRKPALTLVAGAAPQDAPAGPGQSTPKQALLELLQDVGQVIPADAAILTALWPERFRDPGSLESEIERLVDAGTLRRIYVGSEPHLASGRTPGTAKRQPLEAAPAPVESGPRPAAADDIEEMFQLQVQLDLEREKALFWRVAVAIGSLGALVILREWLLWFYNIH